MTRRARGLLAVAALAAALLAAGAFGIGLAAAGDNVAVVEFEPREPAVEPGETVTVDVHLDSEGHYGDVGVYQAILRLDYPAEYIAVTDVEPGRWLTQEDPDAEVATETRIDNDAGVAELDRRLREPGDGVTGSARLATVTFAIADDAPASTVLVTAAESRFVLAQTRYPQPMEGRPAELRVDGGGDRVEPDIDEEFSFETPAETESTADPTPTATPEETAAAAPTDEPKTEAETPAPLGAAVVGILVAALAWRRG